MVGQQDYEEAIIQNLQDAGCGSDIIDTFMQNYERNLTSEQLRILSKQRGLLLDDVRNGQKKLDCLDYLLNRLKKEYAL